MRLSSLFEICSTLPNVQMGWERADGCFVCVCCVRVCLFIVCVRVCVYCVRACVCVCAVLCVFRLYNRYFRGLLNHLVTWTCSFSNPPQAIVNICITKYTIRYLMRSLHTVHLTEMQYPSSLS